MKMNHYWTAAAVSLAMSGCAGPDKNMALENVESEIKLAAENPATQQNAPVQLRTAGQSLEKAQKLWEEDADEELVKHQVYVTSKQLELAKETAKIALADETIRQASSQRNALLLNAREKNIERLQGELSKAEKMRLAAQSRLEETQEELDALNAKKTERGIVLTLSNVLFAFDKAELLEGAQRNLDQLASFLAQHPDRKVNIEGFTDSTGSEDYNQNLSYRRADAVKSALQQRGVPARRIHAVGYGEAYPVASNSSEAGRQQNRRVEIIISNAGEQIKARQ